MFKIKATKEDGTALDVDKMLGGGNSFDDEDAALAVAEAFERSYQKFSVKLTADGKHEVTGVFSVFTTVNGQPVEQVNPVAMRSVLEPSVFADPAVAAEHVKRLNAHFAPPDFEVVEVV